MKILIADDDAISRRLLAHTLERWGYEIVSCCNGEDAMDRLVEERISLAILDWEMPGMNGIEICKQMRLIPGLHAYLILLSARNTQLDLITGLEAGADDFIRKPFDSAELHARLKTGQRIIAMEQSLREQAIRDPLTGLYNRRYMQETLERELSRAERNRSEIGIIVLDIDHFKRINDTYGHEGGDVVLTSIGAFLRDQTRFGDVACRFGGEEFVVILPDASIDVTLKKAELLREGIKQCDIEYRGKRIRNISISAGVSGFPHNGITAEELFGTADAALYNAKNNGRDRVLCHIQQPLLVLCGETQAVAAIG